MYDFVTMEERAREAQQPLTPMALELARVMADEAGSSRIPVRRRIASIVVGLGLKLDPEALGARRDLRLEAASVHD